MFLFVGKYKKIGLQSCMYGPFVLVHESAVCVFVYTKNVECRLAGPMVRKCRNENKTKCLFPINKTFADHLQKYMQVQWTSVS